MNEDFGWNGDERLIGDCMDDWAMDRIDLEADKREILPENCETCKTCHGLGFVVCEHGFKSPCLDCRPDGDWRDDWRDDWYSQEDDGHDEEEEEYPDIDRNDPMDGDAESALASCGWGTDEDYGFYGGEDDY